MRREQLSLCKGPEAAQGAGGGVRRESQSGVSLWSKDPLPGLGRGETELSGWRRGWRPVADQMRSPGCTRAAVVLPEESQHFKLNLRRLFSKSTYKRKDWGTKMCTLCPTRS